MHKSRTWNFVFAISKEDRNRVLPVDGIFRALSFLQFFPDNAFIYTGEFTTDLQTFTLSNVQQPLLFKYVTFSNIPGGSTVYWKKNNGSYIAWTSNTFTTSSFSNNDQLTIAVSTGRNSGLFTITLYESITNSICSNTLSVAVID